jgi:hypothetical protein
MQCAFRIAARDFNRKRWPHLGQAISIQTRDVGEDCSDFQFYHNWCDPGGDKKTPDMRIGLARGRIYERDFM